jgi:hypothetical protein
LGRNLVTIEAVPAMGPSVEVWDKSHNRGPGTDWREDVVPLPDGLMFPIQLRWRVDTVNGISNEVQGVYIDDTRLVLPCESSA